MGTTGNGTTIIISDLERCGQFGWDWVLLFREPSGHEFASTYRTSGDGDGLWLNGRQVEGTTQFQLPARRDRAIKAILRHWGAR